MWEVVLFAGVEKDGVLYRPEKLIDIRLLDAQYPTGQAIEDRLFHLLGVVLFPASGQEDAGALRQLRPQAQLLHPLQTEPEVGGKTDDPGGKPELPSISRAFATWSRSGT